MRITKPVDVSISFFGKPTDHHLLSVIFPTRERPVGAIFNIVRGALVPELRFAPKTTCRLLIQLRNRRNISKDVSSVLS